jgi:hypothetical protein
MASADTDLQVILLLLQKRIPSLTAESLRLWVAALPTSRRPAGELTATQLAELTGYTKAYVRQRLQAAGIKPVRTIAHAGHPQAYYDRDTAIATLPSRKGV